MLTGKINVLGKEIYSLIAAGEVAERPMNIVKEMIENSIDAHAQHITVEIKSGGTTYIRVTDDGSGILEDDIRNVFTPHATSKIAKEEDLNAIGTLGFRGEAMASIASVSRVEVMSRVEDAEIGVRYVIEGGEEKLFEEAGCPLGTTIVVRDVFYNVPARMKFLKKDVTEGNSIAGVVERIAMSHPEISFKFIRDNRQALITSGNNSLIDCIHSVLGDEIAGEMIKVDYELENMRVTGYVTKPYASRKSRAAQFFYVNGRYIQSRIAMASLEQAYKNVIMTGRYPACVLNISMSFSAVDVNVHPAKTEVRFANERNVFNVIYYGAKSAIENLDTVKEAEIRENRKNEGFANLNYFKQEHPSQMKFSQRGNENFWQNVKISNIGPKDTGVSAGTHESVFHKSKETAEKETYDEYAKETEDEGFPEEDDIDIDSVQIVGEAFDTYIIAEAGGNLYYVDKHAAHERMNYEELRQETEINSQLLLESTAVQLSSDEYNAVQQNIDIINKCGFYVEDFGNMSVLVRAVPAMLGDVNIEDMILEIAEKLLENKTDIEPDKMNWIFHSMACRSAVKAGDHMSAEEKEIFIKKLFSMPNIRYCPHGRPVMIKISKNELEKQFGRIQ